MKTHVATLAVIGGSRAYDLLRDNGFGEEGKKEIVKTPYGPAAPARLFSGDGFLYWFMSRHGEKGYDTAAAYVNYRANIWALKKLGVERIVSWSGPGAVNPAIAPGEFVIPHDAIDMTENRAANFFEGTGLGFIRMSEPFCPEIRAAAIAGIAATGAGARDGAVYLCTGGPRLETPAEIKMFGQWGADLVGMTLLPEAFLARQMEMCYAAVCYCTNYAEGVVARDFREGELFEGMLSAAEKEKVEDAVSRFPRVMAETLHRLSRRGRGCKCGVAMERYRREGRAGDLLQLAKDCAEKR